MNDGNKLYRLINNNRLFFILTGSILFFIGFITKYRVYSKTSSGMMLYFLVGIVCLTVAHLSSFKIKKTTSKELIISCIYVIFFIAISFVFFLLFYFATPSLHAAKWLMPIVNLFLFFLGIYTTIVDNFLLFTYGAKTYKFAISYEQSAFAFFLFISILLFVFYFFTSKENRLFIKQISITLLYFIFRYIALIFIYIYSSDISIFYNSSYLLISILPLCFILNLISSKNPDSYIYTCFFVNFKFSILNSFLYLLAVLFFIYGVFLFDGYGAEKTGNIYIDEYHSNGWESVFEPLNTENFGGQRSTYTYYSFVKMLENIKPVHIITSPAEYEKITPEDILIIKTPTVDFTEKEIKNIDLMLKNGGGVWIIGDHTNLLDMSSRLNKIIEPYGAKFNYDAVYDLTTSNLTYYNNKLMPLFKHRVVADMSGYKFATSCSIKTSPLWNKTMIGNNLCSENLDLSHQNYFGDLSFSEEEYFGLFCQCAAKKVGKGRLLVYSDSTTFSSFSVFMHTNPEFIFSSIFYLNKKNSFNYALVIAFVLLLCAFFCSFVTYKKINKKSSFIIFIVFLPVFLIIASDIHSLNGGKIMQTIKNKLHSVPSVYFLQSPDEYDDTLIVRWWSTGIDEYTSLFLAFQRMNFSMREVKELNNSNSKTNLCTVIPKPLVQRSAIDNVLDYCKNGGKIVLFLSDRNLKDSLNFLHNFNIEYTVQQTSFKVTPDDASPDIGTKLIQATVFTPLSRTYQNSYFSENLVNTRIDEFSFGNKGRIYVLIHAQIFDNIGLGEAATVPTNKQIQLHSDFFNLIKQLDMR